MRSKTNPREAAVDALVNVELGAFISDALNQALADYRLSERDKALAVEIVYGTVRMKQALDYRLDAVSKRKMAALEPRMRSILRSGAYQLIYLDRIPPSAAVNESVKLIPRKQRQSAGGYVNAVLRNLIRKLDQIQFPSIESDPVSHIAVKYSHPEWIVERWVKRYGIANTVKFCQINNRSPQLQVRVNSLKTDLPQLQSYFASQGIQAAKARYAPDVLHCDRGIDPNSEPLFQAGHYYVQNESSALAAHAVDPQPGEVVYDLCAAPGGKTTHLAQLMQNQGQIVAVDQTEAKVSLVKENAARLGVSIIDVIIGDAASIELPRADRVLVDAPCSGLGVLRHKPDARWRKREQDINALSKLQREILTNAARLVKPGGTLVYSTCTTEPEENQEVIKWFLEKYPYFRPSALPTWFPASQNLGMVTILPFLYEIDGFFICKLVNSQF